MASIGCIRFQFDLYWIHHSLPNSLPVRVCPNFRYSTVMWTLFNIGCWEKRIKSNLNCIFIQFITETRPNEEWSGRCKRERDREKKSSIKFQPHNFKYIFQINLSISVSCNIYISISKTFSQFRNLCDQLPNEETRREIRKIDFVFFFVCVDFPESASNITIHGGDIFNAIINKS